MAKNRYYQRPDGLFEASRTIKGKRVMFRGKTCREVDQKILAYQEQQEEAKAGRLFKEVADEWERQHEKEVKESARKTYSYPVKRLKEAFDCHIKDIRPLDIVRYIKNFEAQGYAGNTVSIELSVCKQIFSYAVLAGDIDISPATEVSKSRGLPHKERDAITEEQEEIVKRSGLERTAPFWLFPYFLLFTGMRRGEAAAISYSDIDRKAGVIHVTKKLSYVCGSRPVMDDYLKSKNGVRDVPLLQPLANALPKDRIGLVFPGASGTFMTANEIVKNWQSYCHAVGLNDVQVSDEGKSIETFPITPHCFRHSFITICYEAGLDSTQTAKFVGDSPKVVEKIYTHLREKKNKTAVELLEAHFEEDHCVISV